MRSGPWLTIVVLALAAAGLVAQEKANKRYRNVSGGALHPEQACYDVKHYRLVLRVDPEKRSIAGSLTMTAEMVEDSRALRLDLEPVFRVSKLTVDGKVPVASSRRDPGVLRVPLGAGRKKGAAVVVHVEYSGNPRVARNPPWDGGFTWAKTPAGAPWIATTCQGLGADMYWPCKDHPSDKPETMDLEITVPEGLVCASNGVLHETREEKDGWTTFHWKILNPISNYNVALNIAPYERLDATFKSVAGVDVPVHFWVLPSSSDKGKAFLPQILDHLKFFEDVCGPYPFRNEKYGVVETPHLGMEHQTIIAYGNKFRGLIGGYDWLHHHELAHEWWGNLVTNRDWKDMWIHEGFGTYMQALYLERLRGKAAYRKAMAGKRRMGNRQELAPTEPTNSHEIYFKNGGSDIYNKGSWVLHTLRWTLNDDEMFLRILRLMCYPTKEREAKTDGTQCRFVDTTEFIELVNRESGQDLGWFFDVYARQPELPRLEIERRGDSASLRWKVTGDLRFEVPVPVKVGDEVHRVVMKGGRGELKVPEGAEMTVDPDTWLLKETPRDRRGPRPRR